MRPTILVNYTLNPQRPTSVSLMQYSDAVIRAGGLPLIMAAFTDPGLIEEALDLAHGVVFVGGPDYHPDAYGGHPQPDSDLMMRRRHEADLHLAHAVRQRDLPVLGICGGLQLLVIDRGGALVQDIPEDCPDAVSHGTAPEAPAATEHRLRVVPDTCLHGLLRTTELTVNSYHHQAARPDRLGGLRASAFAPDGVIEAVEDPAHPFRIGVQWHPERMPDSPATRALFDGLIAASRGPRR